MSPKISRRGTGTIDTQVGNRIRAFRIERGLSQSEVADALGLTFQQVQKYEKGSNRVAVGRLVELSNLFQCEPHDLIGWKQRTTKDAVNGETFRLVDEFIDLDDALKPAVRRLILTLKKLLPAE